MLFQIKKRLALYRIPNQRTRLRHFGSYFCIVGYIFIMIIIALIICINAILNSIHHGQYV